LTELLLVLGTIAVGIQQVLLNTDRWSLVHGRSTPSSGGG
jgi:hypothetical protein